MTLTLVLLLHSCHLLLHLLLGLLLEILLLKTLSLFEGELEVLLLLRGWLSLLILILILILLGR